MLPSRRHWYAIEEATAKLKSDQNLQADRNDSRKLLLIATLLFVIFNQNQLHSSLFLAVGVWAVSLNPLFTASAFSIALVAAITKREYWGLVVGAAFSAAFFVALFALRGITYSFNAFADLTIVGFWLCALYVLVVSAVTRFVIYLRSRKRGRIETASTEVKALPTQES